MSINTYRYHSSFDIHKKLPKSTMSKERHRPKKHTENVRSWHVSIEHIDSRSFIGIDKSIKKQINLNENKIISIDWILKTKNKNIYSNFLRVYLLMGLLCFTRMKKEILGFSEFLNFDRVTDTFSTWIDDFQEEQTRLEKKWHVYVFRRK